MSVDSSHRDSPRNAFQDPVSHEPHLRHIGVITGNTADRRQHGRGGGLHHHRLHDRGAAVSRSRVARLGGRRRGRDLRMLCYAELGAVLPHNGGEYQLLSRVYHPALGFIAGWVTLVVGFSATLAFYGHIFGTYLAELVPGVHPLAAGIGLIVFSPCSIPCMSDAELAFTTSSPWEKSP